MTNTGHFQQILILQAVESKCFTASKCRMNLSGFETLDFQNSCVVCNRFGAQTDRLNHLTCDLLWLNVFVNRKEHFINLNQKGSSQKSLTLIEI